MHILRLLLFPLSLIYKWATDVRNHLYNIGHKPSFRFEVPVISVGNLNIGGSGKTPMIEYLIRLLNRDFKLATLSRGYGRKGRGIRFASDDDSPATVGDEPFQLYKNFHESVIVVVGEERAVAIPEIVHKHNDVDVILLDDAFQHRSVNPHLSILLTRYSRPFYKDHVMPTGYLRESRKGAARADVIVVTKCPAELSQAEKSLFITGVKKYCAGTPVFFSSIVYKKPVSLGPDRTTPISEVILLTGIANPQPFVKYCQSKYKVLKHFSFADHHQFTDDDLDKVKSFAVSSGDGVSILTTEKDSVRLSALTGTGRTEVPIFFVPIEMEFCENGAEFDALVRQAVENQNTGHQS